MLIKDFINILNFILLVYNNRCVIHIALDCHWVYMLGDVSSDPLVSLDHIDQGNGTQYKQGHTEWTALSYTSFNIDFACRVSIHHDLACYVFAQHPCQFKKITLKAQSLHCHEQVFMIDTIEGLGLVDQNKEPIH